MAAAAALYRSVAPELSVAELKAAILDGAERLPAFAGRSVSGARLDVSGIAALSTATTYTFAGMTGSAGPVSPTIALASRADGGHYTVELGLGMLDAGEVWALSGQSLTVAGQTVATDDSGTVTVDLGELATPDGQVLVLDTTLGAGAYALTVRLLRDGEPIGGTWAAPMLLAPVGASSPGADPSPEPTPGAPGPTPSAPGVDPAPSPSSGQGDPGAGSPDPSSDPSSPGAPGADPSSPGAGPTPSPSAGPSEPGAGTAPGPAPTPPGPTEAPGTPDPSGGSSDGGSQPGATDPGPSVGTSPEPSPSAPASPQPGRPDPTPAAPADPDTLHFDHVGDFRVTSVSPVHVEAWGGDLVTVTGEGLDASVSVLVGGTRQGSVLWAAGDFLMFLTPSATAGSHDVVLSAPGRTSTLPDALVYAAATQPGGSGGGSGGSTSPAPGGGTSDPGTAPGPGPDGGTSDPGTAPDPGGSSGAPGDPGAGSPSGPGASPGDQTGQSPGPAADPGPVTRLGPNGERLVRSAVFGSLGGLWGTTCQVSCRGVRL